MPLSKGGCQRSFHINLVIYNDSKWEGCLQSQSFVDDQGAGTAYSFVWQMLNVLLSLFYTISTFQPSNMTHYIFSICIPPFYQQYFNCCI